MKIILYILACAGVYAQNFGPAIATPKRYVMSLAWQTDVTGNAVNGFDIYNDTIVVLEAGAGNDLFVLDTAGNLVRTCLNATAAPGYIVKIKQPGIVWISDGGANAVREYNYRTCTQIWQYTGLAGDVQSMIVDGPNIFCTEGTGAADGGIVKLDTSGAFRWRYDPSEGNTTTQAMWLDGDTLYFTTAANVNYKIDTTGPVKKFHWSTTRLQSGIYAKNDSLWTINTPLATQHITYFYQLAKNQNGSQIWQRSTRFQNLSLSGQNAGLAINSEGGLLMFGTTQVSGTNRVTILKTYNNKYRGIQTIYDGSGVLANVAGRYIKFYDGFIYATIGNGIITKIYMK